MEEGESNTEAAKVEARLADLQVVGGEALVRRTLANFLRHLAEIVAKDGDLTREEAHRAVGLAGMLGLGRLEAVLRRREEAPDRDHALSRAILEKTREATVFIETLFPDDRG